MIKIRGTSSLGQQVNPRKLALPNLCRTLTTQMKRHIREAT
jgi:hypothetical protein